MKKRHAPVLGHCAVVAVLATLPLFSVPGVVAQGPAPDAFTLEVTAEPHAGPVDPVMETGEAAFQVSVRCRLPGIHSVTAVEVTHQVTSSAPEWTEVEVAPLRQELQLGPGDCVDGQATTYPVVVQYTFTDEAPAFAGTDLTFTARLGHAVNETTTSIVPGFRADQRVVFEETRWKADERTRIQVPILIENLGNADMFYRFSKDELRSSKHAYGVVPSPTIVQSPLTGGDGTARIMMEAVTTWDRGHVDREETFVLRVGSYAVEEPEVKGPTHVLELTIHTQTGSATVAGAPAREAPMPSLVLLVVLGLLATSAVVGRRR